MFAGRGAKAASPSRFGASPVSDTSKPTKISREGVILIKSFEGFRPRAVQRPDGRWMIGYGHTRSAREGLTVSEADAELLLQYDLIPVAKAVNAVQAPLNQHQFDALASFVFSIGVDRFETSDVLERLNAGAPLDAAEALAAWVDEVDVMTPARRRATERALFFADPEAPASLAELLAAPLPPLTTTLVERTVEAAPALDEAATELPEPTPFPALAPIEDDAAPVIAPWMTQDAEVTEPEVSEAEVSSAEAEVTAVDANAEVAETLAAPEAATATEPADLDPVAEVEPAADPVSEIEAAPEPASMEPAPIEPATAEPAATGPAPRVMTSAATFYSPYAVRALGPLAGINVRTAARPAPAPVNNDTASAAEAEAPETRPEDAATAPSLAAIDGAHASPTPEADPAESDSSPAPSGQSPADAAPTPESTSETSEQDDLAGPFVEAAPGDAPVAETAVAEEVHALPPIEVPRFAPVALVSDTPEAVAPLALTSAPDDPSPPEARLVWPEHSDFTHPDQTPLFEPDPIPVEQQPLAEPSGRTGSSPFRLEWSETLTFLVMGGVGLLSFGAAMAAFRQSAQSDGDMGLIGWVLVLIALACVAVSGLNLYQRWGRVDRA